MKLQQSEIKTSCEKCTFAKHEDNKQVGCEAGRLQKFVEKGNAFYNNEFHVLNRFCNMYRENTESVNVARERIESVFGIAIYDNQEQSNIKDTIESIYSINYDKKKLKIVISSIHNESASYFFETVNKFKQAGFDAEFVITFSEAGKQELFTGSNKIDYVTYIKFVNSPPKHSQCSHLVKVTNNTPIDPDLFKKIDVELNDNLEKIVMFESENVIVLPFWLVNKVYLDYNHFDKMADSIRLDAIKNNMYKKYER